MELELWPGWETVRLIGEGSTGPVYEIAREGPEGRERAAVKRLTVSDRAGVDALRFCRAGLDSLGGHVVRWEELREEARSGGWDVFIRMPLLTPLTKTLGKTTGESQVLRIGLDLCAALEACEAQGVVHGGVTPRSVYVSGDGRSLLGGFRPACFTGGDLAEPGHFSAPERSRGQPPSSAGDRYSLGLLLYWLLNQQRLPFLPVSSTIPRTSELAQADHRRCQGETLPPPAIGSAALEEIVRRACAFRPEERYPSAGAMREALSALQIQESPRQMQYAEDPVPPKEEHGKAEPLRVPGGEVELYTPPRRRERKRAEKASGKRETKPSRFYLVSAISVALTLALAAGLALLTRPLWSGDWQTSPEVPSPSPPPVVELTETPLPTPEPFPAPSPTPEPTPTPYPTPEAVDYTLDYGAASDPVHGAYHYFSISGLTPYIFVPNGAGRERAEDILGVTEMLERYGEDQHIVAAFNAGIFYDTTAERIYCYRGHDPDGTLIADGVVLKSTEPLDHTGCDILVIAEDGSVGWADYSADADALARGTATWYDIYGEPVTGKPIVSAVTGFVPILIGGELCYDAADPVYHGYHNYVGHYTEPAPRQIFGVREDGSYLLLQNETFWTLADAAEVAKNEGCVFAYNLDGGDSVEAATGTYTADGYRVSTHVKAFSGVFMPSYLVFTADNARPRSARPLSLRAELPEGTVISEKTTAEELAAVLRVTEIFENADGKHSTRRLYSAQGRDQKNLTHTLLIGNHYVSVPAEPREAPPGTLYYTKTEDDAQICLTRNGNTREGGNYYDYSAGFSVELEESPDGGRTALIRYDPGGGFPPLAAELTLD
ncbi:MAG: phosphodiester glycosidase family protein [Oscillospiraceae bacterium]|nr:phosphodiester glycosidase family protein [Oscillospiraceae bacterium]